MKKFFSMIVAAAMIVAMAIPGFAATITIDNAKAGETYNAYKIFDFDRLGNVEDETGSYSIAADSPWKNIVAGYKAEKAEEAFFTLTETTDPAVFSVTYEGTLDAAHFAAYLSANKGTIAADGTATPDADGDVTIDNLAPGYYFIDTSLGALCTLKHQDSKAELGEKNSAPTIVKTEDKTTAAIGDTVTYTLTVTDGVGTDSAITVHDVMEAGLTLNADSFTVKVNGVDVDEANYTIVTDPTDDCTFEIVFNADYVASLDQNAQIVITYTAELNKDAEISGDSDDGTDGIDTDGLNTNKTWLTYSEQTSGESAVHVETFKFELIKTDKDGNVITDAKFKLYDALTGGNEIPLVLENGVYRPAVDGETGVEIEAGNVVIKGLDKKTYYLEETQAPEGYNLLAGRIPVMLNNGNLIWNDANDNDRWEEGEGGVRVINQAGSELPETGGMGTTLFYVVGGLMMAGAAVLLITKKKMSAR